MKLANKLLNLFEMGRERSKALKQFESLQETIEEHIWKLYAYKDHRTQDVNGWLKSLNKHLIRLRLFNQPKQGSKPNLNKEFLINLYVDEPFGTKKDLEIHAYGWADNGFPEVEVTNSDVVKIQNFAKKYVDLIFKDKGQLTIDDIN